MYLQRWRSRRGRRSCPSSEMKGSTVFNKCHVTAREDDSCHVVSNPSLPFLIQLNKVALTSQNSHIKRFKTLLGRNVGKWKVTQPRSKVNRTAISPYYSVRSYIYRRFSKRCNDFHKEDEARVRRHHGVESLAFSPADTTPNSLSRFLVTTRLRCLDSQSGSSPLPRGNIKPVLTRSPRVLNTQTSCEAHIESRCRPDATHFKL